MEELLALEGLRDVKALAFDIFFSSLADDDLVKRGFGFTPQTLNFSFVGNPGVGKVPFFFSFSSPVDLLFFPPFLSFSCLLFHF